MIGTLFQDLRVPEVENDNPWANSVQLVVCWSFASFQSRFFHLYLQKDKLTIVNSMHGFNSLMMIVLA